MVMGAYSTYWLHLAIALLRHSMSASKRYYVRSGTLWASWVLTLRSADYALRAAASRRDARATYSGYMTDWR